MRCYIKHSEECFIRISKHLEAVKKNSVYGLVFQHTSRCLDILMKHSSSCLIYYLSPLDLMDVSPSHIRRISLGSFLSNGSFLSRALSCYGCKLCEGMEKAYDFLDFSVLSQLPKCMRYLTEHAKIINYLSYNKLMKNMLYYIK